MTKSQNERIREERKEERRKKKDEQLDDISYQILEILSNRTPDSNEEYGVEYFAEKLHYSIPHIQRYMIKLKNLDLIEYKRGIKSYVIKEKAEQIYSRDTKEKLAVIASLKGLLQQYKNTPMYDKVQKFIFMLEPRAAKETSMFSRVSVPPQLEFSVNQNNWDKIISAMDDNRKISFRYESPDSKKNKDQRRTVYPYQLLLEDGSVYLFAHSEYNSVNVVYSLNRIRDLTILPETFKLPDDFDISTQTGGGLLGAFKGEYIDKVKIEFYGYGAEWIKEHKWAKDQVCTDFDGGTLVTFTTTQTWKVFTKIMSWGSQAKPIAPKHLVQWWKNEVKAMADMAGKE